MDHPLLQIVAGGAGEPIDSGVRYLSSDLEVQYREIIQLRKHLAQLTAKVLREWRTSTKH